MQSYTPGVQGNNPGVQGNTPGQAQYQQPNTNTQTVVIQDTRHAAKPKTYRIAQGQVNVHGVMHVVIGILHIIFNIVLLGLESDGVQVVGPGIWVGAYFITTGAFGILAGKRKTACFIITYMVLCICNAVIMSWITLGFGAAFIGIGEENRYYDRNYFRGAYWETHKDPIDSSYVAFGSLMVILSLVEFVISIWSSALCCAAVCCCRESVGALNQPVVAYNNAGMPGQVVYIHTSGYPYNAGQPTYIAQQGNVPVHMAAAAPAYNQPSASPPSYVPTTTDHAIPPTTGSAPPAGTQYQTKDNMANIDS